MSCTQCKISQVLLHSCIQIISLKQTPLAVSLNDFLHMQDEKKRIFIVEESKKKKPKQDTLSKQDLIHILPGVLH